MTVDKSIMKDLNGSLIKQTRSVTAIDPGGGKSDVSIAPLMGWLFSRTIPFRPHTPLEIATVRACLYQIKMTQNETYVYYGRVAEQNGIIILQYWYFYDYDDWRSQFQGANDHEGDWETVSVFLQTNCDLTLAPIGVAFSQHGFTCLSIYRKWDSQNLHKAGQHPVVFVAGGSHAGYFDPERYCHSTEMFGRDFVTPFVDYAEGNGTIVGGKNGKPWSPVLLDPLPSWIQAYKGNWGLFVNDPFDGENGIPGPMYTRDGSYRLSWADPLAWAGLTVPGKIDKRGYY
jgi:hypothetical protein